MGLVEDDMKLSCVCKMQFQNKWQRHKFTIKLWS